MQRAHIKLVHNPYFDEFIYDIIYSLTTKQKRDLDPVYAKMVSTPKKAKAFCRLGSLEQKFHFLASVGIKWSSILYCETASPKNFKEVLKAYQKEGRTHGLKQMANNQIYITTDREFMFMLMTMAQSIHHPQYSLNMEWNKLGYKMGALGVWTKSAANVEFTKANENIDALNRFSLLWEQQQRTTEIIESTFSINENDFRILNFLFRNKHRHVGKEEMFKYFETIIKDSMMYKSLKGLTENLYIQQSAMNKKDYTITALGINLIDKIFQRAINTNNF